MANRDGMELAAFTVRVALHTLRTTDPDGLNRIFVKAEGRWRHPHPLLRQPELNAAVKSSTFLLALIIGLTGCDNNSDSDKNLNALDDESNSRADDIKRIDDGLVAPEQPALLIEAAHEQLLFSWQADPTYPVGNLYQYDQSTGIETLVQGDMSAQTNTLTLSSQAPSRAWHAQQFRLELCNVTDCLSSARIAIDTLLAQTAQILRPSVFLRGERFAESVTTNHDASMIVSTLPVQGAVQIHFRSQTQSQTQNQTQNQTQWIATEPVQLSLPVSSTLLDISSSTTGDTLAVLIKDNTIKDNSIDAPPGTQQPGSIQILERLGEAWVPLSTLPIPIGSTLNSQSIVSLSGDADQLHVQTPETLLIYHRGNVDWSLQPSITAPSTGALAATSVSSNSDTIVALLRQFDELWLVSYQLINNSSQPTWQERHRQLMQGVDPNDDVFMQRNMDNSSLVIAGWDAAVAGERSAVLWRYNLTDSATSESAPTVMVSDSLRTAPTRNSDAKLRFSISENLDTAVLGWTSVTGDNAQLTTLTFSEQNQTYSVALELPHAYTTLAKQSFGQDVVLSNDGRTLLVSTLPGSSTQPTNQAGELLIFR